MASKKKGIKIGGYRITPLGIGVFSALIVLILALIVLLIVNPFGATDATRVGGTGNISPTSTPPGTLADATAEPSVSPSPSPTPTATPEPELRSATIRALGEIAIETELLQSAFDTETSSFDFAPMFSEIAEIIGEADYTIADVEGTLGDKVAMSGNGTKMNTPSSLLTALKDAGVDMLTLANDHALDGGASELLATMENVSAAGLDYVGASPSEEAAAQPVIKEINGIKVGFVAYTDTVLGSTDGLPAYGLNLIANSNAFTDIANARNAGADVVVAIVSWGEMMNRSATSSQQQIALALTSAGADVIIGYNPHVVQPAMWLEATAADGITTNRALCLCATGNFLSNQRAQYSDSGIIFEFTIQETEYGVFAIESPTYIPTYVWRYENGETYEYRTLAVGQWTDEMADNLPDGMAYADLQRMGEIWSEMQSVMGTEVASIARK